MSSDRRALTAMRRRARVAAFEALYEYDTAGHDPEAALRRRLESVAALPADDRAAAAPPREGVPVDTAYAFRLVRGVAQHLPAIDRALAAAASAWPLEQMAKVDKAILRLAIYEILFDNGVPIRAAINEAVELAKLYGGESSPRFVNGVLGTIAAQASRD
ncbi:MAG: transcription antitermination factor NusB [Chloroflexota bacterium]|nr:transcription antitermination factor NusB [Dehalococcoidia bacterium]MDW8254035.1 transcription antitermination factor NusB [Chloroflexota bacterium]